MLMLTPTRWVLDIRWRPGGYQLMAPRLPNQQCYHIILYYTFKVSVALAQGFSRSFVGRWTGWFYLGSLAKLESNERMKDGKPT